MCQPMTQRTMNLSSSLTLCESLCIFGGQPERCMHLHRQHSLSKLRKRFSLLKLSLLRMVKSDGGSAYSSKLDDFEAFVARSKLAALQLQPSNPQPPSQQTQASQSQPGTQVPGAARASPLMALCMPQISR